MFDLSIIIIGYNTQKELFNLLTSINSQNLDKKKQIECIYVDDGSTDFSIDCFNKFDLLFHKKCISLKKTLGAYTPHKKELMSQQAIGFCL